VGVGLGLINWYNGKGSNGGTYDPKLIDLRMAIKLGASGVPSAFLASNQSKHTSCTFRRMCTDLQCSEGYQAVGVAADGIAWLMRTKTVGSSW